MTPDEAKAKAAATYNAAADSYDHPANAFWERYGRRTVGRLRLRQGARVLDVCCGSGASAIPAAEVVGPDGFNPWDRVCEPETLRSVLSAAGVEEPAVVAESGSQPLGAPEDWWPMVLGTGYRATIEQLDAEAREQVRRECLRFIRATQVRSVEVNVVYALATRG